MTREGFEALAVPLLVGLLVLMLLSGCALPAPERFVVSAADGQNVEFIPMPRNVVSAIALNTEPHYRVDAVALRQSRVVWFSNDVAISRGLIAHELKHFRRDPQSPTGYCEHLGDGVTWIHAACKAP